MKLSIWVMLAALLAASGTQAKEDMLFSSGMEKTWCADNPAAFKSPLEGSVAPWWAWFGEPFPGPKSLYLLAAIPKNGYTAIEFYTGNIVDAGAFQTIETTNNTGSRKASISECPGDFDVQDDRCVKTWGISQSLVWSTEGHSVACPLKPHTTYYINVTFTDGFNPESDTCNNNNRCFTEFRIAN